MKNIYAVAFAAIILGAVVLKDGLPLVVRGVAALGTFALGTLALFLAIREVGARRG